MADLSLKLPESEARRDFLYLATAAVGAVGAASAAWPLVDSMNPAADTLAVASTEVDLSPMQVGQSITVVWRGKPVFIRRRTPAEMSAAVADDEQGMRDPQADQERVLAGKREWLVVVGICTHLGCVPKGQLPTDYRGIYGGWFCPCHGSHYDTSGRIRQGPAPKNLLVPPYHFVNENVIRIG